MRTIADIKKEMTDEFISSAEMQTRYELTPGLSFEEQFSKVSLESIIFYVIAVCIWSLENILRISITQQTNFIKDIKTHSTTWYSLYAKKFQFSDELPWGEVEYPAIDEAKQVVKFAAVAKAPGGLMVKVATLDNNDLAPLQPPEFGAFKEYLFRISAAGDTLYFVNETADDLKLKLQVFYDPLVLNSSGERLDGTNDTPVQLAIDDYIKGMDFNGKFVPTALIDALQLVEGVKIPHLMLAQWKYGSLTLWMDIPPEGITPFAGYLRINDPLDLDIEFIPA